MHFVVFELVNSTAALNENVILFDVVHKSSSGKNIK